MSRPLGSILRSIVYRKVECYSRVLTIRRLVRAKSDESSLRLYSGKYFFREAKYYSGVASFIQRQSDESSVW